MSGSGRGKIAGRGAGEWALAAEALLLLAVFRLALAVVPVRWILRWVARGVVADGVLNERDRAIAVRVRWAVEAVVRHSAVRFVCFPQRWRDTRCFAKGESPAQWSMVWRGRRRGSCSRTLG